MRRTAAVTPRLFLGDPPPNLAGCTSVRTAEAAIRVISAGGTAVLPAGSEGAARAVLAHFGASQPMQDDRLHFAKTGSVLHAL